MLDLLKETLAREGITAAVIVDDVYDDVPVPDDIDEDAWLNFTDDVAEPEVAFIESALAGVALRSYESRADGQVIRFLWANRSRSQAITKLFDAFVAKKGGAREQLDNLRALLQDELGLEVTTAGAGVSPDQLVGNVDLVFLDLFLGASGDDSARDNAVARVQSIVQTRPSSPPLVILMSSSSRLDDLQGDCRDRAGLLGCQFRTLHKSDIPARERVIDVLMALASRYRDTVVLAGFLHLWEASLAAAMASFVAKIRRLDLRDYADIQQLSLDAEGDSVGTHMLEAYDQFFHHELEGRSDLREASRAVDAVAWKAYPPPQFLPSTTANQIIDGLIFHHPDAVPDQAAPGLGDVFLVQSAESWGEDRDPSVRFEAGERPALVLLTQSCDLQHGNVTRLLFLVGVARPAHLLLHFRRKDREITPIMLDFGSRYVVEWDVSAPFSLSPAELASRRVTGAYRRVRRFRLPYALQLQQQFATKLTRVGTPAMLPSRYEVGIVVLFRDVDDTLHELLSVSSSEGDAVAQLGRDEKGPVERLALSSKLTDRILAAARAFEPGRTKRPKEWQLVLSDRAFFLDLQAGVKFDKSKGMRPFSGMKHDALSIVGPQAATAIRTAEGKVQKDVGPLIIQVVLEEAPAAAAPQGGAAVPIQPPADQDAQDLKTATWN